MVAFCDGDGEGKQRGWCCSVTTYAGPSIQSLIKYPRWYQTISAHDRLEFAKLLIVQSLMAFEVMQQTVSACDMWLAEQTIYLSTIQLDCSKLLQFHVLNPFSPVV